MFTVSLIKLIFRDVLTSAREFSSTKYFSQFAQLLKKASENTNRISRIVCLGLGKVTSCRIARIQLYFLLALKNELGVSEVQVSDPVFSEQEIDILSQEFGLEVVESNLEGKFKASPDGQTLFYLPHCPKQLTNNLLWANWNRDSLSRSLLVGNSFKRILTHNLKKTIESQAIFVDLCSEFTLETEIVNSYSSKDIFNDLSLHSWPSPPQVDWEKWAESEKEPTYPAEDLEFITK